MDRRDPSARRVLPFQGRRDAETPSVLMSMMQIRVVRMGVTQRPMTVPVRVRLRHWAVVVVLVVVVMRVTVFMFQFFALVFVLMAFREMEP